MQHYATIEINEGRINYDLRKYGSSVVGVSPSATEDEVSVAISEAHAPIAPLKSVELHPSVDARG